MWRYIHALTWNVKGGLFKELISTAPLSAILTGCVRSVEAARGSDNGSLSSVSGLPLAPLVSSWTPPLTSPLPPPSTNTVLLLVSMLAVSGFDFDRSPVVTPDVTVDGSLVVGPDFGVDGSLVSVPGFGLTHALLVFFWLAAQKTTCRKTVHSVDWSQVGSITRFLTKLFTVGSSCSDFTGNRWYIKIK